MSCTRCSSVDLIVCIFFAVYVTVYDWRWIDRSPHFKRRKIIPRLKYFLNNRYQPFFFKWHSLFKGSENEALIDKY